MRRGLAIAIAVTAAASASCTGDPQPAGQRDARPAARPARPDAAPERGFIGVIAAAESADVVPRFSGVLARVHVRAGDRVVAGQVVAELDPVQVEEEVRGAEAETRRAEAELRKARVDVEDARRKLALQRRAARSGVAPASAVEEAALAVKRAVAAGESAAQDAMAARSRAKTAKGRLGDTRLTAPFDGTVALRFRDAGAIVEASAPIVKIVKQGQLRLRFAVPPARARALSPGTAVRATVATIASPIAATIRHVSPALDPASDLIIVEAELAVDPAVAADLRPGLAAEVRP